MTEFFGLKPLGFLELGDVVTVWLRGSGPDEVHGEIRGWSFGTDGQLKSLQVGPYLIPADNLGVVKKEESNP